MYQMRKFRKISTILLYKGTFRGILRHDWQFFRRLKFCNETNREPSLERFSNLYQLSGFAIIRPSADQRSTNFDFDRADHFLQFKVPRMSEWIAFIYPTYGNAAGRDFPSCYR
jgi:hypothetical protein